MLACNWAMLPTGEIFRMATAGRYLMRVLAVECVLFSAVVPRLSFSLGELLLVASLD